MDSEAYRVGAVVTVFGVDPRGGHQFEFTATVADVSPSEVVLHCHDRRFNDNGVRGWPPAPNRGFATLSHQAYRNAFVCVVRQAEK